VTYFNRGLIYERQGKKDLAIADYTKAIEVDPNYGSAYSVRGNLRAIEKEYDKAMEDLNKAIEIDPYDTASYISRGNAFADTQKFPQAIADYQKALTQSSDPATKSYVYCVQGITYTKMGEFEDAITALEQGVKLDVASENSWCKTALENARQGIPTP
jgi:tetratricopeptide (TPR) repeat protein